MVADTALPPTVFSTGILSPVRADSSTGKKDAVHRYEEIVGQKLYVVQGGSIVAELYLKDGSTVSLQSTMDGVYPFLDTAFAGWCLQTGRDPESCDFHDPSKSLWFPPVEES